MAALRRMSNGEQVSSSNVNPVIQAVTLLLLAMTTLMLGFRLLTRFYLKAHRQFGVEDLLIISAFVFGVGQSITMLVPSSRIFGRTIHDVSEVDLVAGLKLQYAGDMLFVASVALAKISISTACLALSPDVLHQRVSHGVRIFCAIWGLATILGLAFRCGVHGSWNGERVRCHSEISFMRYLNITSIVTDAALVALPAWMVIPLQMPLKTRLIIISFFSTRIFVIIATVFQLIYVPRLYNQDWTREAFPYFISLQLVEAASIGTACATYFWPFLRSLRSGLMWSNNTTFTTQYTLSALSTGRTGGSKISGPRSNTDSRNGLQAQQIKMTRENTVRSESAGEHDHDEFDARDRSYAAQW